MKTFSSKQKLIHDCDPGQDDAIAIISILASPRWELIGVTVVGGNVTVSQCACNARRILALCGSPNIPVYEGASQPLKGKLVTLEQVFGPSGLAGGDDLPDPGADKTSKCGIEYLIETLLSSEEPVFICATGPLTNIATAIQKNPEIARSIERLVIMGGCVFPEPIRGEMGNIEVEGTTGKAEYNFAMDPEAAQIVFASNIQNIALIGLNVTRKVLFNAKWQQAFYAIRNKVAHRAADILSMVGEEDASDYGHIRISPDEPVRAVHDVVAAIYLDRPEMFKTVKTHLKITTGEPPNIAGQSLPAQASQDGSSRYPITVVTDCNSDEIFSILVEKLKIFNEVNA